MKIAIIGAGAMGSLFATHLADAGADIWAFDVWQEHVDAMRRDGLSVHRDGASRIIKLHATSEPADAGACDVAMVFVKFGQTAQAVQAARPMVAPATTIVTLQNGIGNIELIQHAYPDNPLAFGLTTLTCELLRPGHIEASYKGKGETYLWPRSGIPNAVMEGLVALLNKGGVNASVEPGIELKIWKKLVVNCCLNTLCAITNQNVGEAVTAPEVWPLLDGVADEIAAAAQARKISLTSADARGFLRSVAEEARTHEPSMLIDVRNGRRTEIDCLNGAVLRICEQHAIPAPYNRALLAMIRAIEQRNAH